MSNAVQLLAMLEPAVRPGGLPGPVRAGNEAIESRSFESLLEEAKGGAATKVNDANEEKKTNPVDPLKELARIDLIDNAALLRLIGHNASASAASPVSDL